MSFRCVLEDRERGRSHLFRLTAKDDAAVSGIPSSNRLWKILPAG